MKSPFPPPPLRGGSYRTPALRAGDLPRVADALPARKRRPPAEDPGREARQRVREEYARALRKLRGEPEPVTPTWRPPPPPSVRVCCGLAWVDSSGCSCGGLIYCPTHSPQGTCTMQYSHD